MALDVREVVQACVPRVVGRWGIGPWGGVGWGGRGQPRLLTAQLALVFSLGTVLMEVAGLPELEDCPVPASEGTLQGHLGAQGRSWRAQRHITLVSLGGRESTPPPMPFTSQGLTESPGVNARRLQGSKCELCPVLFTPYD